MKNENILMSGSTKDATLEIVEITNLEGAKTTNQAMSLYFIKESKASLKFIRAKLNGGSVMTESGALYYSKGDIQAKVPTGGVTGVIGKVMRSAVTQETAFNPIYTGFGEVVLEPSFGHYLLIELDNDAIIVDKSLFYCSIGNIKVSAVMQSNLSSAVLGGEGLFQTKIEGSGWVALSLPVPMSEIEMYDLQNETVRVDGNFTILRSSNIDFTVEKSTKGIFGTVAGGEGLLCTFRGTGMLWLAPTAPVYQKMSYGGMSNVQVGNRNNLQQNN